MTIALRRYPEITKAGGSVADGSPPDAAPSSVHDDPDVTPVDTAGTATFATRCCTNGVVLCRRRHMSNGSPTNAEDGYTGTRTHAHTSFHGASVRNYAPTNDVLNSPSMAGAVQESGGNATTVDSGDPATDVQQLLRHWRRTVPGFRSTHGRVTMRRTQTQNTSPWRSSGAHQIAAPTTTTTTTVRRGWGLDARAAWLKHAPTPPAGTSAWISCGDDSTRTTPESTCRHHHGVRHTTARHQPHTHSGGRTSCKWTAVRVTGRLGLPTTRQ